GCMYAPDVFGIMVGQPLEIRNSDPVMHNIFAMAMINKAFNFAQPVKGQMDRVTFTQREVMFPIACNVHPWMKVSAGVLDHPFYAVTDASGKFDIRNLPAGKYTLGAWHEKLKFDDQEIEVKGNLTVSFAGVLK